jgi:serine/threonine-protein kinase
LALTPGTFLGPYQIVGALGSGGMGEVYRARDTKLNRDVAIKVLLPGVANDPDRLARFGREAQVLASLNHPNIAHIHGLEEADGVTALVLELVEGEDLAQRIVSGPMPLDELLPIARQIADALEAAHEQGIIHRDLKPANIKVRADGTVKVLDFGLAKAMDGAPGSSPNLSMSPTITPAMTQVGMILGTAAYLSPEQARGKPVDKRADIWAFGAVLFEMLTGQRAFKGDDISDVIASVLRDPLDLQALPATTPPAVRRLLDRCLERDPKRRLRDIGEARVVLNDAPASEGAPPLTGIATASAAASARGPMVWRVVAGLAVAAFMVGAVVLRRVTPPSDPFPIRVEIAEVTNAPTGPSALSPDGHTLIFVGHRTSTSDNANDIRGGQHQPMLFVRRLDQLVSTAIPGTEGAQAPWLSPDGQWVAYIANRRKLMKVSLQGGPPVALADVADYGGGDWSPTGDIILGPGVFEGLQGLLRVNQAGGTLRPLTQIDATRKELSHEWPRVLADGKSVLFTIWYGAEETAELAIASLDDGKTAPLGVIGVRALGVVGGQLVFFRNDGVLMAVPFDVNTRRVSGAAVQVQQAVGSIADTPLASMNHAGGLVYARAESAKRLLWADRSGATRPAVAERRDFSHLRISPDGQRIALSIGSVSGGNIWIHDVGNGTLTPLTTSGGARNPAWSRDGRRVLYVSTQGGRAALWWQAVDGSGAATLASVPPHNAWNLDLSPDGITTVYNAIYNGSFNVESFSLAEPHETHDVSASPRALEARARFSPDGRLVAYQSDESGRAEVYIRSFPDAAGRTQVSTDGGTAPVWSPEGKRLYYLHDGSIMSATLARDATLRVLSRELILKGPFAQEFDVSPDGFRFLVVESEAASTTLVAVPNWLTELRRVTAPVR